MKLTPQQVDTIEAKTGFRPLPDEVALDSGLSSHFGDNTFYIDDKGVYVFEELEEQALHGQPVTAVMIAALEPTGNEGEVMIKGVQPQLTTMTVDLA